MMVSRRSTGALLAVLVVGFATSGAGAPVRPTREWNVPDPGLGVRSLAPALDGTLLFVVIKPDTSVVQPVWSSSIAAVSILRSFDPATGDVTTLDPNFVPSEQMVTDVSGAVWLLDSKRLSRRVGDTVDSVPGVSAGGGLFRVITADPGGGVWVGGSGTGLFHVGSDLEVTHYTRENSPLPTDGLTAIHIDDAHRIWVALWDLKGVLCKDGDTWTTYNASNSGISRQNIWCIASEPGGDIWIGQGWDDPSRTLVRFDGEAWNPVTVNDAEGSVIRGTVRRILRVGERLWVWIDRKERPGGAAAGGELLVRGDHGWEPVAAVGKQAWVRAVSVDENHRRAWVLTESREEPRAKLLEFAY